MKQWLLPSTILILSLLSILTLTSIAPDFTAKQLSFFMIGFLIFFFVSQVPFKTFLKLSPALYIFTNVLLVAVLLLAPITRGTSRWIDVFGLFAVQPSQLAIPTTALFLIHHFNRKPLTQLKNLFSFITLTAIPAVLILIEPDLGTTLVYLISISVIVLLSKTKLTHLIPLIIVSLFIALLAWNFVLHPYQKARISSFISPDDTQGAGYNARQSLIAAGSGGLTGKGLGQGIQSHLRFLPEKQTDFVFASFAEEFGFIGSSLLVFLYLALVFSVIATAQKTQDKGEALFCYVVAILSTTQIGINIGMNIGLLPITGITLPFMSYGGSSILSMSAMYAIIQSIRLNKKQEVSLHLS